jgi:hypothetical protein
MANTCPLCNTRKARRPCPAVGQQICTVCCGTKRQREIACPETCVYLASASAHPPAVVQRRQERDLAFLLPLLTALSEPQYRLLVLFQGLALRAWQTAASGDPLALGRPTLIDQDVVDASNTMAATLETAGKGIIYHHQATSIPAQQLVVVFESAMKELVANAGAHGARLERDAAAALRQLARSASSAAQELAGDEEPIFLKLLSRMMTNPPQTDDASVEKPDTPSGSGLIIPG